MSSSYRYIIGIDLGTTNSALAYVDLAEGGARAPVRFFEIPQLVAAGEVAPRAVLPSFLYLPGAYDLPAGATALPWALDRDFAVGEFAREQGVRVPGRLVASAKSWLSHRGVDRTAAILPWGAKDDVAQVSPVTAAARYLAHMREAWNAQVAGEDLDQRFERQLIILTVPASFDEVARELTLQAAAAAGFPQAILLEEPLAAFYAWLARHEDDWQTYLRDGQLVLICDIGGGTTDFTLVGVGEEDGRLQLQRLAVGDHLLLGGDNMDLALGRHVETKLMGAPGKLDPARWAQLVAQCRAAKETLLGDPTADAVDITVVGAGGGLIAGTRKATLTRADVADLILDGFFPQVDADAAPDTRRRAGLTELGLPYVQDPAITRHLAAFWRTFGRLAGAEVGRAAPMPDFILFNGGALTPAPLRERLAGIVGDWFADEQGAGWQPEELQNPRPELAVAIGAAYYGRVRMGAGVRIGSGTPRAYYIGIRTEEDEDAAATPEAEGLPAVCLVPRGVQEGFDARLTAPTFTALTNQPVSFQVYTSAVRPDDRLGDVVTLDPEEVAVLPPVRTVLRFGRRAGATSLPVQLAVRLTETGTLEIYCDSLQTDHRWPLQFDVRAEAEAVDEDGEEIPDVEPAKLDAACATIHAAFGGARTLAPEQVRKQLEADLGLPKEEWPAAGLRKLADCLLDCTETHAPTPQHEAFWLNLLGYCLRPGVGDPADELRMKRVWGLYLAGMRFGQKVQVRTEWWIFWRRVAAGLSAGKQVQVYEQIWPSLQPGDGRKKGKATRYHLGAAEELEVWLMLANFERLTAEVKAALGKRLLARAGKDAPAPKELWALSRFGARTPAYGPANRVVAPSTVEGWLERLLATDLPRNGSTGHALVHLAQRTGDRARDIDEMTRRRVEHWLAPLPQAEELTEILNDPARNLSPAEQDWVFGEALPPGLTLRDWGDA